MFKALLATLCCVLLLCCLKLYQERDALHTRVFQLEAELQLQADQLKKIQGAPLQAPHTPLFQAQISHPTFSPVRPAKSADAPAPNPSAEHKEWQANYQLRQIERYAALSDTEQKRMLENLRSGQGADSLASVIGNERAQSFIQSRDAALKEAEDDEVQSELFQLSRKLSLTSEQEEQLKSALLGARESDKAGYDELQAQTDRAMSLHSAPADDGGAELRTLYEQIRTQSQTLQDHQKQLLAEQLQGVLSDQQMNLLLEEQAKERGKMP